VAAMHLPHQSDAFPHLDGLLPKDLSETNALRPRARLRYRP
jgi:hypothetical protein